MWTVKYKHYQHGFIVVGTVGFTVLDFLVAIVVVVVVVVDFVVDGNFVVDKVFEGRKVVGDMIVVFLVDRVVLKCPLTVETTEEFFVRYCTVPDLKVEDGIFVDCKFEGSVLVDFSVEDRMLAEFIFVFFAVDDEIVNE